MTVQDIIDEEVDKHSKEWLEQGIEKGKTEGLAEGILKTAKAMLKENCDTSFISKVTGLSEEEIRNL